VRAALNTGVSWWRPRRREIPLANHAAAAIADPAGGLDAAVLAALRRLPARQREVVLLRDVEGMSSEEVCSVLSLTEGNQRVLLHRGRSRLRQLFEDEFREVR